MNHSILVSASVLRPRWLQWGVGLACATVLAGCATTSDQAQGPEDTVNKRSAAYLKARQAGSWMRHTPTSRLPIARSRPGALPPGERCGDHTEGGAAFDEL